MKNDPTIRKYGLIIGLVASLIMLVNIMLPEYSSIGYINVIMIPIGLILCCIEYSNEREAQVTFGQLFQAGFYAGMLVTAILVLATILFVLLFPEMKNLEMQAVALAYEQQNVPDNQSEMVLNLYDKYYMAMKISGTIMIGLLGSLLFSLIGAAVAKKKPQY